MATTLVTAPTEEVVAVSALNDWMRLSGQYDALLTGLAKSARLWAESFTRRAFVTQTWRFTLDNWPCGDTIRLPFPPLRSVKTIKYVDYLGIESPAWPAVNYIVDTASEPGRIVLAYNCIWPVVILRPAAAIMIEFECGYGLPDKVPEDIKTGIKMMATHLFEHPEAIIDVPQGNLVEPPLSARNLLWTSRVLDFEDNEDE